MARATPHPDTPDAELARLAKGRQPIQVAAVVTKLATPIDFVGPWEVFAQTIALDRKEHFDVYGVSTSLEPLTLSGGLIVVPQYTLETAPPPDIILVPALGYGGGPVIGDWLRRAHQRGTVIVSVCDGARELAEAGILDGLSATTHHGSIDDLGRQYPKVEVVGGRRFVKGSPTVYTAGGLMSGIDLALHLVGQILGTDAARRVADHLEYEGRGWRSSEPR
jgi:transcriptional regulator GlxA family with amidase domain